MPCSANWATGVNEKLDEVFDIHGVEVVVDKRSLELPKAHIKATGKHQIVVNLHPEVAAKFHLNVVAA